MVKKAIHPDKQALHRKQKVLKSCPEDLDNPRIGIFLQQVAWLHSESFLLSINQFHISRIMNDLVCQTNEPECVGHPNISLNNALAFVWVAH